MPILNENHFICDYVDEHGTKCGVDFYYEGPKQNPMGGPPIMPNLPPAIVARQAKMIMVAHGVSGYTTWYCSDDHAIEAIGLGRHLPPMPTKVAPATEAEMEAAKRGLGIVKQMREGKPS